jgi:hypothetical protein
MPIQITINAMTGSSPYDVYLCDSQIINCFYITTITSLPYVFDVPPPLDSQQGSVGDKQFTISQALVQKYQRTIDGSRKGPYNPQDRYE